MGLPFLILNFDFILEDFYPLLIRMSDKAIFYYSNTILIYQNLWLPRGSVVI